MIRARVDVTTNFGAITDAVDELSRRAVTVGAAVGARAASRVVVEEGRVGETRKLQQVRVLPVRGTPDGWEASFRSEAYYRLFQDLGTLRGRTAKLSKATKARSSSPSGQQRLAGLGDRAGIEPIHMYRAGRRAGRKAMLEVINRGIS